MAQNAEDPSRSYWRDFTVKDGEPSENFNGRRNEWLTSHYARHSVRYPGHGARRSPSLPASIPAVRYGAVIVGIIATAVTVAQEPQAAQQSC
ncbi:hypothetical protein GCM10009839_21310 [Catenulispora yoronensis]|uniref:Uncharacterized protein n=1 Tax=Catenulispora yoronensis TaxID=450799 RepID=A0ABP5FE59_9ACTN